MTRLRRLLRSAVVPGLAVITALLFGAIVIILPDFDHLTQIGTDPVAAIGGAIGGAITYALMNIGAFGVISLLIGAVVLVWSGIEPHDRTIRRGLESRRDRAGVAAGAVAGKRSHAFAQRAGACGYRYGAALVQ